MVQIVGHRAFKGQYIENTSIAFERAYEAKSEIIETDLQMTRDGVVVVNHDSDTGRIWDHEMVISEHNYDEVSKLRCKDDATLKMLTLVELLEWAVDHPNTRLMLDIKFSNNKIILIKAYAAMLSVKNDIKYWQSRVIWGLWLVDWFEYGVETGVLKDFDIVVISFSLDIVKQFVEYSHSLNNPHYKLFGISIHFVASWTERFRNIMLPVLQERGVKIFLWTVNKLIDFKYMSGLPVYGVVTDDPIVARQLCIEYPYISEFTVPAWTTFNGLRFHVYLIVYEIVCSLLLKPWVHRQFAGFSFAYFLFLSLRKMHLL
ncbi:hypothetical protein HG535_0B00850 [Zygotorulaspora mrakii]|uniref:GP-PDE domain-containing protein n=1 Tax=Zygotorulaspora mrakii TaxID=42260 RepID=A0A7H9AY11_ZYGMR|nr:uncharacterized protein HG535_0B00850 [Zygotorulaspora mrakii]QLG71047.1 hypothetical protein HG535_0B00850 [Zygotorulaspora mrakii]